MTDYIKGYLAHFRNKEWILIKGKIWHPIIKGDRMTFNRGIRRPMRVD